MSMGICFCSPLVMFPFCNISKSLYQLFSRNMILSAVSNTEEQPAWVPKITKVGFKKTKIPPDVYAMLLWEYERNKSFLKYETLNGHNNVNIVNNRKKKQSSLKNIRSTYTIELRF